MKANKKNRVAALFATVAVLSFASTASAQDVAWAWVDPVGQPSTFTPPVQYQFSTAGGTITVDQVSSHRFTVRVPGISMAYGGSVHATAYGGNHTAVVRSWSRSGFDLLATIDLYDPSGAPVANRAFSFHYRYEGPDSRREAYVWADNPTSTQYTPNLVYSWNGNRAAPSILRSGVGNYAVTLPGLGNVAGSERGHVQVSPYGSSASRAMVRSWYAVGSDLRVLVDCFDMAGAPTDAWFVMSYNEQAAPIAAAQGSGAHVWADNPTAAIYAPDALYTDSNGLAGPADAVTIRRLGTGDYEVNLPGVLSVDSSTAQATAYGHQYGSRHASIAAWVPDGCGGTNAYVRTFDANGWLADSKFTLLYLTNHPAAQFAWAWVNPGAYSTPTFTPSSDYQFSAAGQPITIERTPSAHIFTVVMPGMGPVEGVCHVTAYGGNHTAMVVGDGSSGGDYRATVMLLDAAGQPANNAPFTVLRRRRGALSERQAYVVTEISTFTNTYTPFDSWNGDRPDPTVFQLGTGRYSVTLPGLAVSFGELGHVQVSPCFNGTFDLVRTTVTGWSHVGNDVVVEIACQDDTGLRDAMFMLSYNEASAPISAMVGSGAHVWANQPTSASYTPHASYTDSNGSQGPANSETITRLGVGYYLVDLPNVEPSRSSTVQVSCYEFSSQLAGGYAAVDRWSSNGSGGTYVYVRTYGPTGNAADSRFTLLYLTDDPAVQSAVNSVVGTGCNGPTLSGLTRPILCRDWLLGLDNIPAGAVLGFIQLGLNNPVLSVGPSAPGCTIYTNGMASILLPMPVSYPAYNLAIPADPSFLGVSIYAQGGALVPGVNPFGLAASNGLRGVIGDG